MENGINLNYHGGRYLDLFIGKWTTRDPLDWKYPGQSPYNYVLNSPTNFIDPNGMEVYVDKSGNFIDGPILDPNDPSVFMDMGDRMMYYASLNDPKDLAFVYKGVYTGIILDFENGLESILLMGGVNEDKGFFGKYSYALKESLAKGKMDYIQHFDLGDKLALIGGVVYNEFDTGNYLWGAGMRRLGFSYLPVKVGSEVNAFFNTNRQNPYLGKPAWMPTWAGDSPADQRAIRNGFYGK
jgi:RHS repeat-associated protein